MVTGQRRSAAAALLGGVCLSLLAGNAHAQEPPSGFTWYVLNTLNSAYFDIEDPTNRPPLVVAIPPGVLTPVDVSKDGVADWLIRWPQGAPFCGTGGCRHTLYVSDGEGFLRVFDRQAWDLEIRPIGNEIGLEASFHHLNCASTREVCRLAWAWVPGSLSLAERPSADGASIISGFGEPAVDLGDKDGHPVLPADMPLAVYERYLGERRVCSPNDANEFNVLFPAVASVPDVNGDGRRDWVMEPAGSCDGQAEPQYGYQVWATEGQGGATLAFTAAPGRWPWLSVDASPAQLLDGTQCAQESPCKIVQLEWDSRSRSFRPASLPTIVQP